MVAKQHYRKTQKLKHFFAFYYLKSADKTKFYSYINNIVCSMATAGRSCHCLLCHYNFTTNIHCVASWLTFVTNYTGCHPQQLPLSLKLFNCDRVS